MRLVLGNVLTQFYDASEKGLIPFYRVVTIELDSTNEVCGFRLDTLISNPNSTFYATFPYIDIHRKDLRKLENFSNIVNNPSIVFALILDMAYDARSEDKAPFVIK